LILVLYKIIEGIYFFGTEVDKLKYII